MEWKEAIENYNLLTIAELSVLASLTREESRGSYLRPEFPEPERRLGMLAGHRRAPRAAYETAKRLRCLIVDWESIDWTHDGLGLKEVFMKITVTRFDPSQDAAPYDQSIRGALSLTR